MTIALARRTADYVFCHRIDGPLVNCSAPSSAIGGLVSVALSVGSPRLGVTQLPVLWSPDFPRLPGNRGRPANSP